MIGEPKQAAAAAEGTAGVPGRPKLETQRTVHRIASFTGVGLHSGVTTTITFRPAPARSGLRFVRVDLPDQPEIAVVPESARQDIRNLRRTILTSAGAEVHTVEHVLAAVTGLGIDNLIMELNGPEAPEPADGSARSLVEILQGAGVVDQGVPREYIEIHTPVSFQENGTQLLAVPHDGYRLSFTLQYENPAVGTQHRSFEITPELFASQIAPARTFALWEEVSMLQEAGMIKGGTLHNAVVVRDGKILNEDGLRFPDEFVRHKILDLMGDLSLLGRPLRGHVISVRSGHATNVAFMQRIHESLHGSCRYDHLLDRIQLDINAIERIMPHRYPMLLVDRILLMEPTRVVGLKNVTANEPFFVGHFPGHPIMPAVLILEAMAQVGGILLLNTVEQPQTKLVYFMAINNAKFRRPVLPGDTLIFELGLDRLKGRICKMTGKGYVRGALVAEAELLSKIMDR
jgi:UDP-3-O-[3-hydroxymyristoyl] N-acetylglucosamine deacetylase / 3-hydroxyacyl-[acyl-carrier-protein] dehydratase